MAHAKEAALSPSALPGALYDVGANTIAGSAEGAMGRALVDGTSHCESRESFLPEAQRHPRN